MRDLMSQQIINHSNEQSVKPVKVLEVVCEGDNVMDGHLGLHDVDLLLARGRQQVDLLHPRLMNTVKKGYWGIYELERRQRSRR